MVANVQWMARWQCNRDLQWWRQWVMAGVTMGDSNSGGMIPMTISGGSAMDGKMAATAQWQLT
jgi:hypothetical protein